MTSLLRDQRGSVFVQIAALVFIPIVVAVIAAAIISSVRTGAGLTDALTRSSQSQLLFDDFTSGISDATTVAPISPNKITTTTDPQRLPAGLSREVSAYAGQCVSEVWELVDSAPGLRTLTHTERTHTTDCASPVTSTRTTELTGLSDTTRFRYENPAGRTLNYAGGKLVSTPGTAPTGITQTAWDSTAVNEVHIDGVLRELLSDRKVVISAHRATTLR